MNNHVLRTGPARRATACLAVFALVACAPWLAESRVARATAFEPIALAELRLAVLTRHNALRAKHGSPAMTLDDDLNATAQAWAEEVAASGNFAHSPRDLRGDAGENIFASFSGRPLAAAALAEAALGSWYGEGKDYDYANPQGSDVTGHFTQVVWKGSTRLGVGAARGMRRSDGREVEFEYVVCQYSPPGNSRARYAENVASGPGASTRPPADTGGVPAAGSGAAPSVAEVTFKEVPTDGGKLGTLTLFTSPTSGDLEVEVNGRVVAPPLEAVVRTDRGFVRLKGTRRDLNVVKGANTVVLVVDGERSAPATFTF